MDTGLSGGMLESCDAASLPSCKDRTAETWEDVRVPGDAGPQQEIGPGWRGWGGSALFHAGLLMIGVAFVLLRKPPVPLSSDAIAVTLALEPSVPVTPPPAEIPSPSQEPVQPESAASPSENPPPAASGPPETPAPPLPEPEPRAAAAPEPAPVPQPLPKSRATARPRAEPLAQAPRPPPAPAPRTREPAVAPSAAPVGPTAAGQPQPQPSPAPVANQQAFAPLIPPRPVSGLGSNRKPDYPIEARSRRQQGRVLLRVQVSATGDAASVEIVSSSGHPILDQAARAAVRAWRFVPATRAGMAVAASADVPIEFRMDE
jgi:protein TonB